MPWRGPEQPGEFPTLGYLVAEYIEDTCVIPDGDHIGEPFLLTDEMLRFLLFFYRLDPETGRFVHFRGGQLVRPQKWGKGPFSAAWVCAEADGPVLPAGWDARGEPVGRPWSTPWIQITAVSEDQTANVWRALQPMIELGDLKADIPDTGITRINLPGGGIIEPVTASARSRLGQRITGAVQDETHSWWETNGGRKLADNQRRNLAGTDGRFLETSNAWDPVEESVAQDTWEDDTPGVFKDMTSPGAGSVKNEAHRARMIKRVYSDSMVERGGWVRRERIDAEIVTLMKRDPAQAERFFLNRIEAGEGSAFDIERWKELGDSSIVVPERSLVVAGVDGARFHDSVGMVATSVDAGHQWPLDIIEQPENPGPGYEHDLDRIDGVMLEFFETFDVWRVYVDPQYIEHLLDIWQGRWGEKRVVPWYTNRNTQIAHAVRRYTDALGIGDLTHNADEVLTTHIGNAVKRKVPVFDEERRQMHTITKVRRGSPRKMDGAMAAVISWEARGDAIAAGALNGEEQEADLW